MNDKLAQVVFGEDTNIEIPDQQFSRLELQLLEKFNKPAFEIAVTRIKKYLRGQLEKFVVPPEYFEKFMDGTATLGDVGKLYISNQLFEHVDLQNMMVLIGAYGQWAAYNENQEFCDLLRKQAETPVDTLKRILEN